MKKLIKILLATLALTFVMSCRTTVYNLGPTPSGEIVEQVYPVDRQSGNALKVYGTQSALIGLAVDLSEHCNGGKVATVTIEKSMFGDSHKVKMNCAKSKTAPGAGLTSAVNK